jgi:amino acid permease
MNKSRMIKLLGLVGAVSTGLTLALGGNVAEGVGIIAASLSSITAINAS